MSKRNLVPLIFFLFLVFTLSVSAQNLSRGPFGPALPPSGRELDERGEQIDYTPILMGISGIAALVFFKKKNKTVGIVLVIIMILLFIRPALIIRQEQKEIVTDWQRILSIEVNKSSELQDLTKETVIYDYSDPVIQTIKNDILSKSKNQKEAIQMSLDYVYDNIEYISRPDSECYSATTSSVIKDSYGICTQQTFANIGILRSMGIPSRVVGGCLYSTTYCDIQFAVMSALRMPVRKPKFTEIGEINISQETFSRKGGLHLWLEAYIPSEGWVQLEATSGSFITSQCYTYNIEPIFEDRMVTKQEMCVTNNLEYARWCAEQ